MKTLASLAALVSILAAGSAHADRSTTRRFGIIAGANDGGTGRALLRYAGSDAAAISQVLGELGGVDPHDRLLLLDPDRASLQHGFASIAQRLEEARAAGVRAEVFFYYSGHSDDAGLLLGHERFDYVELRDALGRLPADVRVAILDSCASGAFTRRKGGVARPAFLVDSSSSVKGHAFLTASSADEAAQESDRIGASFFTHHLVSGLRGAADTTGSGKVTLTEAYAYAFRETLAQTERTQGGAQHPAYEIELVGSGDLVMTDLRATSAGLVLEEALAGRVYVRDGAGNLVVEVRKQPAAAVELGLGPGTYSVTLDDGGSLFETQVTLTEGRRSALGRAQLRAVGREATVRRGDEATPEPEYVVVPFDSAILSMGPNARPTKVQLGLHLLAGRATRLDGAQFALGIAWVDEQVDGAQISIAGNYAGGDVHGAQLSIGANYAGGDVHGAQVTVGVNQVAGATDGAQVSVGANHAGGDVSNSQISVGGNVAGGNLDGVQAAVGLNAAAGDAVGGQFAVGVNSVAGKMEGVQAAVGGNAAAQDVKGAQFSVGANVAGGHVEGSQASVGANVAGGHVNGTQLSVGANVAAGNLEGAQFSVGANTTAGHARGAQFSVGANVAGQGIDGVQSAAGFSYAPAVDGLQLSNVNVAGKVDGAQIGLVNVAGGSANVQIGLVNFADEADVSIGLLSYTRKGRLDLEAWASDVNAINLGLKTGARHTYGLITVGSSPGATRASTGWSAGLGLGSRLEVGASLLDFVNVDLTSNAYFDGTDWNRTYLVLRAGFGWELGGGVALVAGPTLNLQAEWGDRRDVSLSPIRGWELSDRVRLWPGVFAGFQI